MRLCLFCFLFSTQISQDFKILSSDAVTLTEYNFSSTHTHAHAAADDAHTNMPRMYFILRQFLVQWTLPFEPLFITISLERVTLCRSHFLPPLHTCSQLTVTATAIATVTVCAVCTKRQRRRLPIPLPVVAPCSTRSVFITSFALAAHSRHTDTWDHFNEKQIYWRSFPHELYKHFSPLNSLFTASIYADKRNVHRACSRA